MISCIIMDLDGTIANEVHRQNLIPDWDSYHKEHIRDKTYIDVEIMWKRFQELYPIMIMTGRDERFRETTVLQLEHWGLEYAHLYMRPEGNDESNADLKWRWCNSLFKKMYLPVCALDDNPKACVAFQSQNIPTFQIYRHGSALNEPR